MYVFIVILFFTGLPLEAQSRDDVDKLDAITAQTQQAQAKKKALETKRKAALKDIERLRTGLIAAAAQAQSYEKAVNIATDKLTTLSDEKARLSEQLRQDQDSIMDLLALLQRLERTPPPAIAVQPREAAKAAQAASLMASISLALEAKTQTLKEQLRELDRLESDIDNHRKRLSKSEEDLTKRRRSIDGQVKEKTILEASIREQSKEQDKVIAKLVGDAKDLESLIETFEARSRAAKPRETPAAGKMRGQNGDIPIPRLKPRADRPASLWSCRQIRSVLRTPEGNCEPPFKALFQLSTKPVLRTVRAHKA